MDRVTKERRYEVPRQLVSGKLHRPALHKCLDEGTIGLPMVQWLDSCQGLRGSSNEDWLVNVASIYVIDSVAFCLDLISSYRTN